MNEIEDLPYYIDDVWPEFLDKSYRYLYDVWCWEDPDMEKALKIVERVRELPEGCVANIQYDSGGCHMAWIIGRKLALFSIDKWTATEIVDVVLKHLTIQEFISTHPGFYLDMFTHLYDHP